MTSAFETIGTVLKSESWSVRAELVDAMLINGYVALRKANPGLGVRETLSLLLAIFDPLIQGIDEPAIADADHANMLALFAPERAHEAGAWGEANGYRGDDMTRWMISHPGHALLTNLLLVAAPAPTVH